MGTIRLLKYGLAATILVGFMLMIGFAVTVGILVARGVRLAAVESGSMTPVLRTSDAVLVWPASPSSLKVGEVVSVASPAIGTTITHRLETIRPDGTLVTKGDANTQPDPPLPPRNLKGRVVAVFPGLGSLLDELHKPAVLVGVLAAPLLLILITEAYNLAAAWRAPYRYPGYGI